MTRWQKSAAVVLLVELILGGVLVYRRLQMAPPPLPDLSALDSVTAAELRDLADQCRSSEDWRHLAAVYQAVGFFPEAEACYRQAAVLRGDDAWIAFEWAFCLSRLGRTSAAIEQYQRALKLGHSQPANCWYFIGQNCLREEKANDAASVFAQAPDLAAAGYERAKLHYRAGESQEARALLDKVLADHPLTTAPNYLRGRIETALKNPRAAAAFRDRAERGGLRLPSPFDEEWERVSTLRQQIGLAGRATRCRDLMQAGEFPQAADCLRELLRLHWEASSADQLADIEIRARRPAEAVRLLEEVLEREGPSLHYLWRLADAYEEMGQLDKAVPLWERAIRLTSPQYVKDVYFKLGSAYAQTGQIDKAKQSIAAFHHARGVEAFWQGDTALAQAELAKALEQSPDNAAAWFYLGECRRLEGNPAKAREAYERCLKISPEHGRAHDGLSQLGP
jgi:tetratricopeptide (TPR) repeat protein